MDTTLDNNPFAISNGASTDNNIIPQKGDGLLLNLTDNFKSQNGSDLDLSPTGEYYSNTEKTNGRRDISKDFDDEDEAVQDLDAVDDVLMSPALAAARALAEVGPNNNPKDSEFNPFMDESQDGGDIIDLQKQQSHEFEGRQSPRDETPTPPADTVHDVSGLVDNVAESGEDSEDEWNYFKGDAANNKENIDPLQPDSEVAELTDEGNMSQLNPNAAEFIPVSPTRSIPSPACRALINDEILSQSPKRPVQNDIDISVPNPQDFENEVQSRPHEVEICSNGENGQNSDDHNISTKEAMENFLNNGLDYDELKSASTPSKATNDEFHFGPNAAPFTPAKLLDQSEAALSTKAVFGDESVATIGTTFNESSEANIDFSVLNKDQDPMSTSFYQDREDDTNPFDLNKVHVLPEDIDAFLSKPEELNNTTFNDSISDLPEHDPLKGMEVKPSDVVLDNDEKIQTTDLDRVVDDEKELASPVSHEHDLLGDMCNIQSSSVDLLGGGETFSDKSPLTQSPEPELCAKSAEISSKSPEPICRSPQHPDQGMFSDKVSLNAPETEMATLSQELTDQCPEVTQAVALSPQPVALSPDLRVPSPDSTSVSPQPEERALMSPEPNVQSGTHSPAPVAASPQPPTDYSCAFSPEPSAPPYEPEPLEPACSPVLQAVSPAPPVALSPQPFTLRRDVEDIIAVPASPEPAVLSPVSSPAPPAIPTEQTAESNILSEPVALSPVPVVLSPVPFALSPVPIALSPEPTALSPEPIALSLEPTTMSPKPAKSPEPRVLSPQHAMSPEPAEACLLPSKSHVLEQFSPLEPISSSNFSEFVPESCSFPQRREAEEPSDFCDFTVDRKIDAFASAAKTDFEKDFEEEKPFEDVTSSVKDDISSPVKDLSSPLSPEQNKLFEDSFVSSSEPFVNLAEPIVNLEAVPSSQDIFESRSFADTESVATTEVNSFLERSLLADMTSPLSPRQAVIDETLLLGQEPIDIKTEHINREFAETAVVTPSEESKQEELPIVAPADKEIKAEEKETAPVEGILAGAAAIGAAAVAAAAVPEKKPTLKPKSATAIKRPPPKTSGSPTKAATPAAKASAPSKPTATTRVTAAATKTTTALTKTTKAPLASAKAPAPKPMPRPKTTTSTTSSLTKTTEKKSLMNGDAKTSTARTSSTAKKAEVSKTAAPKTTTARPSAAAKTSTASRPATAPAKTAATPRTSAATATSKPRPTTLSARTTTAPTAASRTTTSTTRVPAKAAPNATSPRTNTTAPKARPATAPAKSTTARVPLTKTVTKGPDTEKQIKDSANKLTASRTTTTTTSTRTSMGGRTTTSTTRKTETKPAAGARTLSKTTTATSKATTAAKKPTEIIRKVTKTTKVDAPKMNGVSAVTVVTEQITVVNNTINEITNSNDSNPTLDLIKDNSPVDNKLLIDNTLIQTTAAD